MKQIVLLLLVCVFPFSYANSQIHNYFTWDNFGSNERRADAGPDAISSGSWADAQPTGHLSTQGLAPGSLTILGTTLLEDIDLELNNGGGAFNQTEIEISADYRRNQAELDAGFYAREEDFAGGPKFYFGMRIGKMAIDFAWDDGAGGYNLESHDIINGFFPGDQIPQDGAWRTYTFIYDESLGLATVRVDGVLAWSMLTVPGRALVSPSNGPFVGYHMDNLGVDEVILDNVIIQTPTPLPVELINFHGQQENSQVLLDWDTRAEVNFDYFEIEHATDGRDFAPVGRVYGEGTGSAQQSYSFAHERPAFGANYYRLRQVDLDGSVHYSNRVEIEFSLTAGNGLRLYPNPIQDQLNLQFDYSFSNDEALVARIYDMQGRLVQAHKETLSAYSSEMSLPAEKLTTGMYLLKVQCQGRVHVLRFSK